NNTAESKPAFILHMVLRVFYLLVLFSGIMVYVEGMAGIESHMMYGIKVLVGLLSIGFMEISIVRLKKKSVKASVLLIVTIVLIVSTVIMCSILLMGMLRF